MGGNRAIGGFALSHLGEPIGVTATRVGRLAREEAEAGLASGATRSSGAGNRAVPEAPDDLRTCFEKDRDRIVHSRAFRRLAGKTQVFVFPADHQRTRLTHALEVAQVATAIARATALNVSLTDAIALGHDCGHGPGGHASEAIFASFLREGFHHGPWGADVVLEPLNLCEETLDGIRCHSWSLARPSTPEGAVVSWADRIAYCAHDLEDAVHAGVIAAGDLPEHVRKVAGSTRSEQLDYFVSSLIEGILQSGLVAMPAEAADALGALRAFNYDVIYNRPDSVTQGNSVATVLVALVEHFVDRPHERPGEPTSEADDVHEAVRYVNGMTDRYAFDTAVRLLGWDRSQLPRGIDVGG